MNIFSNLLVFNLRVGLKERARERERESKSCPKLKQIYNDDQAKKSMLFYK